MLLASPVTSAPQRLRLDLPSFISFVLARFISSPLQRQGLPFQLASQLLQQAQPPTLQVQLLQKAIQLSQKREQLWELDLQLQLVAFTSLAQSGFLFQQQVRQPLILSLSFTSFGIFCRLIQFQLVMFTFVLNRLIGNRNQQVQ